MNVTGIGARPQVFKSTPPSYESRKLQMGVLVLTGQYEDNKKSTYGHFKKRKISKYHP